MVARFIVERSSRTREIKWSFICLPLTRPGEGFKYATSLLRREEGGYEDGRAKADAGAATMGGAVSEMKRKYNDL